MLYIFSTKNALVMPTCRFSSTWLTRIGRSWLSVIRPAAGNTDLESMALYLDGM
jgi:hypothetical protein